MLYGLDGVENVYYNLPQKSLWRISSYPEYKAALKSRAQQRKDLIARMTEAERDTYKKRAKMLSAARKLMVGYRKAQREEDKKASSLTWGKMSMHSFEPEFARALEKAKATDPDKFADIQPADLIAYLRNPKASFFGSYTSGIDGLANRAIQGPKTYVNAPLDSRAEVNWDAEAAAAQQQGEQ